MNGNKLTIREKIAAVMSVVGFLIALGAAGQAELSAIWADEYYIRSGIGLLLMFAAIPVSGDMKGSDKDD